MVKERFAWAVKFPTVGVGAIISAKTIHCKLLACELLYFKELRLNKHAVYSMVGRYILLPTTRLCLTTIHCLFG